jgi:fatty acid desaturase
MAPAPDAPGTYVVLRRMVIGAGLLERAYGYYLWRGGLSFALLLGGGAVAFLAPREPLAILLPALLLAFGSVQVALVGHDAGHLAVFNRRSSNFALGSLCWSLAVGISFWYWHDRHNRHHASTNDRSEDPDVQRSGVVALYAVFLPLAFRIDGWRFALWRLSGARRVAEVTLLLLSTLGWLAPATVLGWWWVAVFGASQVLAGIYLSLAIAPNHIAMPTWPAGTALPFLDRQVLSSRNVAANRMWDFVFGGLNYQIEHHLFPTMPRNRFAEARALVKPFCTAHGLPYTEMGAFASYRLILAEWRRVGTPVGT